MSIAQYGRKVRVTIITASGNTLDVSLLRIVFTVKRGDYQTPNTADIRVYNVSGDTANAITLNAKRVLIEAGYDGNTGLIFDGDIKQRRTGRIDQLDSYVDIVAVDGDRAYNFSTITWSVARGAKPADKVQAFIARMIPYDVKSSASVSKITGNGATRGQAFYGLTRDHMRDVMADQKFKWSVQNMQVTAIPDDAPLPDSIVVISPATGLIGVPEQTESGIRVRVLLNPAIKLGTKIQITNAVVNQLRYDTSVMSQVANANARWFNKLNLGGYYYVLGIDYIGDTRGQDFYSDLRCLAINADIPFDQTTNTVSPATAAAIPDANFGPLSGNNGN